MATGWIKVPYNMWDYYKSQGWEIIPDDESIANSLTNPHAAWTIWVRPRELDTATSTPISAPPPVQSIVTGIDPGQVANALYGKVIALSALGLARFGQCGLIYGPYFDGGSATFAVSFGFPCNVAGTRRIYEVSLDGKVAWELAAGSAAGAALDAAGFISEAFTARFYGGTLTQAADPLEIARFGSQAVAYRPQMMLWFQGLPLAQFDGKVPFVSAKLGDTTGSAVPADGLTLGICLERIANSPWLEYDSSTFDTNNVSDIVQAMILTEDQTFLNMLRNITRVYKTLDILQTDKLRVNDRGATTEPDLVLDRDRISAETGVQYTREGEGSVARELELITIDPGADYVFMPGKAVRPREPVPVTSSLRKDTITLPIVMGATTRMSLVHFVKYAEEQARKRVSFTAMAYGYELEPGDLVALSDIAPGFVDEVFAIIETSHGANYVNEIVAEQIIDCTVEFATVTAAVTWNPLRKAAGITLSNVDMTASSSGNNQRVLSTAPMHEPTYFEIDVVSIGSGNVTIGALIESTSMNISAFGVEEQGAGYTSNGTDAAPLNVGFTTGDRIGVAFDPETGGLWFRKNGTWLGNDPSGAPAVLAPYAAGRVYYPGMSFTNNSTIVTLVPEGFAHSAPAGFSELVVAAKGPYHWNSAAIGTDVTLLENDTKVRNMGVTYGGARMGVEACYGKQVWAIQIQEFGSPRSIAVGITDCNDSLNALIGSSGFGVGYRSDGTVVRNFSTLKTYTSYGIGAIIMVATDATAEKVWFGRNGTWNGDPGAGTGDVGGWVAYDISAPEYAYVTCILAHFMDDAQLIEWPYAIPTGFTAPEVA